MQAADPDAVASKIDAINEQYRELLQKMQQIERERHDLELRMNQVADLAELRGGQDTSPETVGTVGAEQREQLEAQQEEIPELPRVSSDVGGVLMPKGRLTVEPSVQYLNTAVTRVALEGLGLGGAVLFGDIDVRSVERQTLTTALTARYGLTNRLEAEVKASWVKRSDNTITRPVLDQNTADRVFNAQGDGLGDIEIGLRYQFRKRPNWPFMVGNLRIKSDTGDDPFEIQTAQLVDAGNVNFAGKLGTGSGFWSVSPSLTFIMPSDPVAIFGSIGYLWTLKDDKGVFPRMQDGEEVLVGFGEVDPGDAIRLNFGMGIGLNEMSSISFSYALDRYTETTIEHPTPRKVVGSDITVGKFIVGYSVKVGRKAWPVNLA
ncbi:MAG: hypothetical protein KJP03_05785, partial [Gammaproteobacteria bacterium]|nr:hypothetical protein [Gammaproteobacteria bacterium]